MLGPIIVIACLVVIVIFIYIILTEEKSSLSEEERLEFLEEKCRKNGKVSASRRRDHKNNGS